MNIHLPNFNEPNILVIGDIMLDRYWSGDTSRISPEAPVPIVKVGEVEDRLGGAANVAKNIAALGCKTSICGVVGKDPEGATIANLLQDNGIAHHNIVDDKNPTITKLRILSRHQQLIRMDFEELCGQDSGDAILQQASTFINSNKVDALIISDYAKGTIVHPQTVIALCRKKGIPVFADPKGTDFQKYRGATLITPNLGELEAVVGKCQGIEDIYSKAEKLLQAIELDAILITLSEKGMALVRRAEKPIHIPTYARDVFDVTGAGDTVIATLAASIASGASYIDAVRLANVAAGVVVGKLGTSTVSKSELETALQMEEQHIVKGVLDLPSLLEQIKISRAKAEKIVFTNGCFDILHAGHVRYLKQAAELGDRLIVAMNSDDSVKHLKGEARPIVRLEERMEVIASLKCVDWVVAFDDDTPLSLIEQIAPDTLVKGGDYETEKIVGYDAVKSSGGKTRVLPFVEGCSTSSIIEKIKSLS